MADKLLIQLLLDKLGRPPNDGMYTEADVVHILVSVNAAKSEWANNPNHGWNTDVYDKIDEAIQQWPFGEPKLGCKECIASLTNDHRCTEHAE